MLSSNSRASKTKNILNSHANVVTLFFKEQRGDKHKIQSSECLKEGRGMDKSRIQRDSMVLVIF